MKYCILLVFLFNSTGLFSQTTADDIYGTWVVANITHRNGKELSEENPLKYSYLKYSFVPQNKLFISDAYPDNGIQLYFEIIKDRLIIKNTEGQFVNQLRILEHQGDNLALIHSGEMGSDDINAMIYRLIPEVTFQNLIPTTANDIYSINSGDTVYKESPKFYANFKGSSFTDYVIANIGNKIKNPTKGKLLASFIVSKTGEADSLKIIQSMSPEYDALYTKIFNSAKNKWEASYLHGKTVNVKMFHEITSSLTFFSAFDDGNKATAAYEERDYETALYYYDLSLKKSPDEVVQLFKRGMCKHMLGNDMGACLDWKKVKESGSKMADAMLEKYCKTSN